MPRRPKRNPYRAYWIDWCPAIEAKFGSLSILTAGLATPARVRAYPGKRSLTLIAVFGDGSYTVKIKDRW